MIRWLDGEYRHAFVNGNTICGQQPRPTRGGSVPCEKCLRGLMVALDWAFDSA